MSISMNLWSVEKGSLIKIQNSRVYLESQLEDWVLDDPMLLNLDVMIVARQVHTTYGGYIDLLAITREGDLVVIELKRDKTPRDIVSQCLDYASWVCDLNYDEICDIYEKYNSKNLTDEFPNFFDEPLPETLNENHQMVIVAASLDDSTERIINYLADNHAININAIFFNVFDYKGTQILGRSFLNDPEKIEEKSNQGKRAPWTGYYFVNTGIHSNDSRKWELNTKYSYISAGGGSRWINAIKKLSPGDKIFGYIKGSGYVGYGVVEESAIPVTEFSVGNGLFVDNLPSDHKWKTGEVTDTKGEWLVRVKWLKTVEQDNAKWLPNGFANQNVVCKLRDTRTFEYLSKEFGVDTNG
ncbi:hypothetical protein MNBD_GAMMA14-1702 [hydrothermal vent metagenome]|uniref:Endonuclease NucS C-terminal domain-containing protein n=1 Tax=hydrothermal vent metagenome TaxID=652676 RepID=A0A3B0YJY0_9ZZZZ